MTAEQYVTIAEAAALTLTALTIAVTAFWRRTFTPWWARFTWTPRLTPGIRAEAHIVMGDDGHVGVMLEKFAPEDNVSEIFAQMTDQWFRVGSSMGLNLNWSSKVGAVIETPEGREYVVALVRPVKPEVRAITDAEARAMQGEGT